MISHSKGDVPVYKVRFNKCMWSSVAGFVFYQPLNVDHKEKRQHEQHQQQSQQAYTNLQQVHVPQEQQQYQERQQQHQQQNDPNLVNQLFLVVGTRSGDIQVMDMDTCNVMRSFRAMSDASARLENMTLMPVHGNVGLLLTTCSDRTVNVLSLQQGTILTSIVGHGSGVCGVHVMKHYTPYRRTRSNSHTTQRRQDQKEDNGKDEGEGKEESQLSERKSVKNLFVTTCIDGCIFIWEMSQSLVKSAVSVNSTSPTHVKVGCDLTSMNGRAQSCKSPQKMNYHVNIIPREILMSSTTASVTTSSESSALAQTSRMASTSAPNSAPRGVCGEHGIMQPPVMKGSKITGPVVLSKNQTSVNRRRGNCSDDGGSEDIGHFVSARNGSIPWSTSSSGTTMDTQYFDNSLQQHQRQEEQESDQRLQRQELQHLQQRRQNHHQSTEATAATAEVPVSLENSDYVPPTTSLESYDNVVDGDVCAVSVDNDNNRDSVACSVDNDIDRILSAGSVDNGIGITGVYDGEIDIVNDSAHEAEVGFGDVDNDDTVDDDVFHTDVDIDDDVYDGDIDGVIDVLDNDDDDDDDMYYDGTEMIEGQSVEEAEEEALVENQIPEISEWDLADLTADASESLRSFSQHTTGFADMGLGDPSKSSVMSMSKTRSETRSECSAEKYMLPKTRIKNLKMHSHGRYSETFNNLFPVASSRDQVSTNVRAQAYVRPAVPPSTSFLQGTSSTLANGDKPASTLPNGVDIKGNQLSPFACQMSEEGNDEKLMNARWTRKK